MAIDLELSPKTKRPAGEPCCEPVVYPDVERAQAVRIAEVAQALGDPIRLQLVDAGLIDVERRHRWAYYSVSPDTLQELTAWLS